MSTSSLLLFIVAAVTAASATDYSDCARKLSTLERALYETVENEFQLNRIFFPPSMRTSRFIRVNYDFDFGNETFPCNVTYIWAIGSFLFFQPPTVFMFNSLFFNYPNNDLTVLHLKLPYECRALIQPEVDGVCSCRHDSRMLDVLTQQVSK